MIHNYLHSIRRRISKLERLFNFLIIFRQFFRIVTSYNKWYVCYTYGMSKNTKDVEKNKEDFKEKCAKGEVLAFT